MKSSIVGGKISSRKWVQNEAYLRLMAVIGDLDLGGMSGLDGILVATLQTVTLDV